MIIHLDKEQSNETNFLKILYKKDFDNALLVAKQYKIMINDLVCFFADQKHLIVTNPLEFIFDFSIKSEITNNFLPFFSKELVLKEAALLNQDEKNSIHKLYNIYNTEFLFNQYDTEPDGLVEFRMFSPLSTLINSYEENKNYGSEESDKSNYLFSHINNILSNHRFMLKEEHKDIEKLFYRSLHGANLNNKFTQLISKHFSEEEQKKHYYQQLANTVHFSKLHTSFTKRVKEILGTIEYHDIPEIEDLFGKKVNYLENVITNKHYDIALEITKHNFIHDNKSILISKLATHYINSPNDFSELSDRKKIETIIFNIMDTGFDVNTPFLKYESLPQFLNILASGNDFNRHQKDDCLYMKDYITNLFLINEQKFLKNMFSNNKNIIKNRI